MLKEILKFLLGLLVINVLATSTPVEGHRKKLKYCKFDYLLECFNEPIALFTSQLNGTGIVSNEDEFEQYCL